jgi:hypothetical protein
LASNPIFYIFFEYLDTPELHSLNLKLCRKVYNKIDLLDLIVVPQLSGAWQHDYSTKIRQAGHANEQPMCLSCLWAGFEPGFYLCLTNLIKTRRERLIRKVQIDRVEHKSPNTCQFRELSHKTFYRCYLFCNINKIDTFIYFYLSLTFAINV